MKIKLKKYIYFINDVTNTILKKDRVRDQEIARRLRLALIMVSVLLLISIIINIIQFIKYV